MKKETRKIKKLEKDLDVMEDKYIDEQYKFRWGYLLSGILIGLFFGMLLFYIITPSIYEKVGIDKDDLVEWHTQKNLPYLDNCSFEYNYCLNSDLLFAPCEEGVDVFCDENKIKGNENFIIYGEDLDPTFSLRFKDITIKDILDLYLEEKLR